MTGRPSFDEVWGRSQLATIAADLPLCATISARSAPPSVSDRPAAATTLLATTDHPLAPDLRTTTLPPIVLAGLGRQEAAAAAEFTEVGTLGEGGMGRVLLARQRSLGREVAVKVLKPATRREVASASLLAEARVMGHLEHPGVVPVHALGRDADGGPVLVMKRVDGVPWSDLVATAQHPAWAKLASASEERLITHLEILVSVCNTVHFAHTRGIVHRDLKPHNVMVGEFGEVYVGDWGLALVVASVPATPVDRPVILGTPAYMAPELVRGDPRAVDARTDVYLLGAILHELLTGTHRNGGDTLEEVLRAGFAPRPVDYGPAVPEELAAIANRATSAAPEQRFASAQAFGRAVTDHLRHRGSIEIARTATEKLSALRQVLAEPAAPRAEETQRAVTRLANECRFGFLEARRIWRENRVAIQGLQACHELLFQDAIARENAAEARRVLDEIDEPPPALVARVQDLEDTLRRRAREHERLQARARDLDPRIAATERTRTMVLGLLLAAVLAPLIVASASGAMQRLTRVPLVLLAVGLVAVLVMGRRALASGFNRRAIAVYFTGLLLIFAHRWLAGHAGEAQRAVLRGDLFILATLMLSMAITQLRALALAALPVLVAAVALPRDEVRQIVVFFVAATAMFVIMLAVSFRTMRQP